MSGRAAKRQRRGQPEEEKAETIEAFTSTEEFVERQGADLQNALHLTADHTALFAQLQSPDKELQGQGMNQIITYKAACDKASSTIQEIQANAEQSIEEKRAELEEKKKELEKLMDKKKKLDSLAGSIQQTKTILEIGETVATNAAAEDEDESGDESSEDELAIPPQMMMLLGSADNFTLGVINTFLDLYSLFQWGRVVVGLESSLSDKLVDQENQPESRLSVAHEIGMAIFNHTVLPKQGYLPCGDLGELFLDVDDETVEEEESIESEGRMQFQSLAWQQKYQAVRALLHATTSSCCAYHDLEKCFEDSGTFNYSQFVLMSSVLDELRRQMYYCTIESSDGYGWPFFTMQSVVDAAHFLNIHFSAPLETQYQFTPIKRDNSRSEPYPYDYKNLGTSNGRLTLRDLACMNPRVLRDQVLQRRPELDSQIFAEVRTLQHEELVQYVKESISNWIEECDTNNIDEKYARNFKFYYWPPGDSDTAWDDWVAAGLPTGDTKKDLEDVPKLIEKCAEELQSFVRNELDELDECQSKPSLLTKQEPFSSALYGVIRDQNRWVDTIVSVSGQDLAQQIIEDFAFGVATQPFHVKRPGRVPIACHLIIGKHHGITMAPCKPLQYREDAFQNPRDSEDTSCDDTDRDDDDDSSWHSSDDEDSTSGEAVGEAATAAS